MPRKPSPSFIVVFRGHEVYPEAIPWQRIAQTLRATHQLSRPSDTALDEREGDLEAIDDEVAENSIRLIGIRRGSTGLECLSPYGGRAVETLRATGLMLERGTVPTGSDTSARIRSLREMSRIAKALKCRIDVRDGRDRKSVLLRIDQDSYGNLVGALEVDGETSIEGVVQRVGGATDLRCTLRLPTRKELLYCDVASTEIAQRLAARLYERVVVTGVATWLQTDFYMLNFKIQSVSAAERSELAKAFKRLRAVGGAAWDGVSDPDRFLMQLRS